MYSTPILNQNQNEKFTDKAHFMSTGEVAHKSAFTPVVKIQPTLDKILKEELLKPEIKIDDLRLPSFDFSKVQELLSLTFCTCGCVSQPSDTVTEEPEPAVVAAKAEEEVSEETTVEKNQEKWEENTNTEKDNETVTSESNEEPNKIRILLAQEIKTIKVSTNSRRGKPRDERKKISWKFQADTAAKGVFSTRCDVVYKTIFRYLRKFYQQMFQKFVQVKCTGLHKNQHLKLFCEGLLKTPTMQGVSLNELMLCIGSIIYPSKMVQLKKKVADGEEEPNSEAKQRVFDSIIKFRDLITKFSLKKLVDLLKGQTYGKLFDVYHLAIKTGKISKPETMISHDDVYMNAFATLRQNSTSN